MKSGKKRIATKLILFVSWPQLADPIWFHCLLILFMWVVYHDILIFLVC
jgi:hypothetical protein